MISACFQSNPFNITEIQVYAPTTTDEQAEVEWFYEDLQDLLECLEGPFHYRGLECKSRKSRDTLKTGKFGLGVQKEAGQWLTKSCQENELIIANTLFQ